MTTVEDEIREVMARYCWHVDHGEWPEWLALFTADSVWGARGARPFEGAEAMAKLAAGLAKKAAEGRPQRHFISNVLVSVQGESATLRSYLAVLKTSPNEIGTVGEYVLELSRQGGRWLIRRMIFDPALQPVANPA